jgi:hypothetical protein
LPTAFTLTWERKGLLDGVEAYVAGVAALAAAGAGGSAGVELDAIDDERLDDLLPAVGFEVVSPRRLKGLGGMLSLGNLRATWSGPAAEGVAALRAGLRTLEDPAIRVIVAYDGNRVTARLDASNEAMTVVGVGLSHEEIRATADAMSREVPSVGPVAISSASASG